MKEVYYLVYKITNNINGKVYIGSHKTSNLEDGYMGSGKLIKKAIAKYGKANFTRRILFFCDTKEQMLSIENRIVNESFVKSINTYNMDIGGIGESNNLDIYRDKAIASFREKMKDKIWEEARLKKVSEGLRYYYKHNPGNWTGKKHKEESKKKIGEASCVHQKGKGNSQYGTMWITDGVNNRKTKKEENIPEGWYKGRKIKV